MTVPLQPPPPYVSLKHTLYLLMPAWQLRVLGEISLRHDGAAFTLERKTAALLTYLALEGPTSRSKLAGLFWPDTSEKAARNNLSQVTRRLKTLTGTALLTGDDLLQLTPELQVDAAELKLLAFSGAHADVLTHKGTLLATSDYDELLDFSDWLYTERERLHELRRDALLALINTRENDGEYLEALRHTETLLSLDPVSEEAHRISMRLHYLAGNRPAALQAYGRCKETLQREMGVEPLPETVALAQQIEQGIRLASPARSTSRSIPLSILRPPLLVGREQEWARMEAAWEAGQIILISGPPGSGKSRLIMDFAQSKGTYLLNEGRPGDDAVPFLSSARGYRRFFSTYADVELEPWVRTEMARLLPDLFHEQPPPIETPEQSLRFHEAIYRVHRLVASTFDAFILDDLQFYDGSSFHAATRAVTRQINDGYLSQARVIACFRTGELPEAFMTSLHETVAQGFAVHIQLEPLSPEAIEEMLGSLQLDIFSEGVPPAFVPELLNFTGGNPLFITETLKSLAETGQLSRSLPKKLPASGRVRTLINSRLQRLTPNALHLAWAAAVAQADFSLELGSALLEKSIFDLAEPWTELERSQVFAGHWFAHDLLYEAALAAIPAPIRTLLHRRCAAFLQAHGGSPARVALHYEKADDLRQAAPFLYEAGQSARKAFQFTEAAEFYRRAAKASEAAGDVNGAFDALIDLSFVHLHYGLKGQDDEAALIERLAALARTPLQHAKLHNVKAMLLSRKGDSKAAEAVARAGLGHAVLAGATQVQVALLGDLGEALYYQGRIKEAAEAFLESCRVCRILGDEAKLLTALSNVAFSLDVQDLYGEASKYYKEADALAQKLGDLSTRAILLNNYGFSLRNAGYITASIDILHEARALLQETQGNVEGERHNIAHLAESYAQLGHYSLALNYFQKAILIAQQNSLPHAVQYLCMADIYTTLAQFKLAEASLQAALAQPVLRESTRGLIWLATARMLAVQGKPAQQAFAQAEALMDLQDHTSKRCLYNVLVAPTLPLEQGTKRAQEALYIAEQRELGGLMIAASSRYSQLLRLSGHVSEAMRSSHHAIDLMDSYDPLAIERSEVLWNHYHMLKTTQDPAALAQLKACRDWLMDLATNHCPSEFRENFLALNPTNRAILNEVKRVGLELTTSTD